MRKIVLYGIGLEGEKFYCGNRAGYMIGYCIDKMNKENKV